MSALSEMDFAFMPYWGKSMACAILINGFWPDEKSRKIIMKALTIYLIPPVLSLLVSLILAGIAIRTVPRTTGLKLFSLICLWLGLLSPIFIRHHILDSVDQIFVIER
jgi:hypothetical protein